MDPANPDGFMGENVTIEFSFNISNIIVTGNYATVDGFSTFIITVDGESHEESVEQTWDLIKVDNSWKIYYSQ